MFKQSEANEVVCLSTLQTVLLVSLAVIAAWKIGTSASMLGWAALSPVLLLRSPNADKLSDRLFRRMTIYLRAEGGLSSIFVYSWLAIASVLSRTIATLRFLPQGLIRLPENWSKVIFQESIFDTARFTPSGRSVTHQLKLSTIASKRGLVGSLQNQILLVTLLIAYFLLLASLEPGSIPVWLRAAIRLTFWGTVIFALGQAMGLFCQVLAISYRISVKASALLWLPLLFAVRGGLASDKDTREILLDRQVSPVSQLGNWLAIFGVFSGIIKFVIVPTVVANAPNEVQQFLPDILLRPTTVWEVVFFLSALMTVLLTTCLVVPGPRRLEKDDWSETHVRYIYNGATLLLAVLATYTSLVSIDLFAPILPNLRTISELDFNIWPD